MNLNSNADASPSLVPTHSASALTSLTETARRLGLLLEEETYELKRFATIDVHDFNRRKQQGLLDLDRALRSLGTTPMSDEAKSILSGLRTQLSSNLAMLSLHIEAMTEVAELIKYSIRRSESDGTYGPRGTIGSATR